MIWTLASPILRDGPAEDRRPRRPVTVLPEQDTVPPRFATPPRKPGRLRLLLACLWLASCAFLLVDRGEGPWLATRLDVWRLRAAPVETMTIDRGSVELPVWGLGDLDGDGHQELVETTGPALLAYDHDGRTHRTLFEHELPAGWSWVPRRGSMGPIIDYDGDGRGEIPLTLRSDDRRRWRLLILDPLDGPPLLDVLLPVGEDRRREPHWDGFYTVKDTLTVADGRLALLVFCSVLYDALGRSVLALDAQTGEIIWRHDLGPQPQPHPEAFTVGRPTGHRERILLLATGSPSNLGPLRVGGFGDDQARLFAIDTAGKGLWSVRLDSLFATSSVRLVDWHGRGEPVPVTTTANRNDTDPGRLAVHDPATGRPTFVVDDPGFFVGLTLLPGPRLVTVAGDRQLREYVPRPDGGLAGRTIRRYRTRTMISREFAGGPAGADGAPWYVLATWDGVIRIHDHRHRVLGRFASPVPDAVPYRLAHWLTGDRSRLVMSVGSTLAVFELRDSRGIWIGFLTAGWSLGLAGALGILLSVRPGRLDIAALRAILARRLSEVAHRDFRMVRDIVEFPAFLRDREAMRIDSYRERIEELRRDLAETTVPHLQATLDELAAAGYAPAGDGSIRRGLDGVRRLLVDGETTAFADPAGEPARRYDRLSRDLHTAFDHVYRDLHRLACIDGAPVVRTLLTRRAPELRQAGIVLHGEVPDADPEAPVLADAAQLGFIVDGLVANAVRAMAGDGLAANRLEIRWRSRRNFVDLLVRDTGVGIAEDARERIFTVTVESSGGSGFGLRRSREILRQWGGDLQLVDPQPERGAALRLTLRVFTPPRTHREAPS